MKWNPIIKFRETSIFKAFFLTALALAMQVAFTIYFKNVLDDYSHHNIISHLSGFGTTALLIITSALFSFISFIALRILFGFGKGMVIGGKIGNEFWS